MHNNNCTVYTQMYWYSLSRLYMQGVFRRIELAKQVTSNASLRSIPVFLLSSEFKFDFRKF